MYNSGQPYRYEVAYRCQIFAQIASIFPFNVQVETPMGEEVVPDMSIVNRAKTEDLNRRVQYQVCLQQKLARIVHLHRI